MSNHDQAELGLVGVLSPPCPHAGTTSQSVRTRVVRYSLRTNRPRTDHLSATATARRCPRSRESPRGPCPMQGSLPAGPTPFPRTTTARPGEHEVLDVEAKAFKARSLVRQSNPDGTHSLSTREISRSKAARLRTQVGGVGERPVRAAKQPTPHRLPTVTTHIHRRLGPPLGAPAALQTRDTTDSANDLQPAARREVNDGRVGLAR